MTKKRFPAECRVDDVLRDGVQNLAHELYGIIEQPQGHGFASEGLMHSPDREFFFNAVRGHLFHTRRAARILEKFLRKYKEY